MNEEAAIRAKGCGPKMVSGSAARNVGKLEHDVAPENARRLRVLEPRRAEEIALDRARSGALIFPDATERQSASTELTVAGVAGGPRVRILLAPAVSPPTFGSARDFRAAQCTQQEKARWRSCAGSARGSGRSTLGRHPKCSEVRGNDRPLSCLSWWYFS